MARKQTIETEQILEVAREVFLEQGMQGTTAEIAERAGISEGTIYRRFDTKNDLFVAAMDIDPNPEWRNTLENLDDDADLESALVELGEQLVVHFKALIPKLDMIASNLGKKPLFETEEEALPVRVLKPLTNFFHQKQRGGRIGLCDPEIAARMFAGTMFHYAFAEISGLNDIYPMPRQTYVRSTVKMLVHGIDEQADD